MHQRNQLIEQIARQRADLRYKTQIPEEIIQDWNKNIQKVKTRSMVVITGGALLFMLLFRPHSSIARLAVQGWALWQLYRKLKKVNPQ